MLFTYLIPLFKPKSIVLLLVSLKWVGASGENNVRSVRIGKGIVDFLPYVLL